MGNPADGGLGSLGSRLIRNGSSACSGGPRGGAGRRRVGPDPKPFAVDRFPDPFPLMPTVLSLHLGANAVHAAVSVDGRIDVLALADDRASVEAPDPTDGHGLVRLLVDAHARCVRIADAVPDELVLVRADGAGAIDPVLVEAARRARVPEPAVLDEMRAVAALAAHGPRGVSRDLAPALGGIFWHRRGDAPTGPKPIVTRADLGGDSRPDRPPAAPSVVAVGPRTVFEEDGGSTGRRRWASLPLASAVVVVALGVLGALLVLRSDEQPIAPPPATTTLPVSTTVPTTTVPSETVPSTAPSTTDPLATDPTTTVPTTTVPPTTVPSPVTSADVEDVAVPTTTVPDMATTVPDVATTTEAPRLGTVTLSGVGLTVDATTDDEVLVGFGDDAGTALPLVSGALGEPVGDSGWGADGACSAAEVRRLGWGGLQIVLARNSADDSGRFVQWYLDGLDSTVTSWWTLERIGIGSTVADLRAAHGVGMSLEQPSERDPAGWFDTEPRLGDGILGAVGNTTDTGRVLLMWAGEGCVRRFS